VPGRVRRAHDREYNERALARTHAWAGRCAAAQARPDQALFGIVAGRDLGRPEGAERRVSRRPEPAGYAIGGLSVGASKAEMYAMLDVTAPLLPAGKPRYLMGVGAPEDLLEGVARGIDLFDCVLPTRLARNAALFTRQGRINLRNARFERDPARRGRLRLQHVPAVYAGVPAPPVQGEELLGYRLATIHNVHFLLQLMRDIRAAIAQGGFPP